MYRDYNPPFFVGFFSRRLRNAHICIIRCTFKILFPAFSHLAPTFKYCLRLIFFASRKCIFLYCRTFKIISIFHKSLYLFYGWYGYRYLLCLKFLLFRSPEASVRVSPKKAPISPSKPPPKSVLASSPPKSVVASSPAKTVLASSPTKSVLASSPQKSVLASSPAKSVLASSPPTKSVLASSPSVSAPPRLDLDPAVSELNYFTAEEVEHMRSLKARLDSVLDNEDNISVRWVREGKRAGVRYSVQCCPDIGPM
jgi:hypothetical protein